MNPPSPAAALNRANGDLYPAASATSDSGDAYFGEVDDEVEGFDGDDGGEQPTVLDTFEQERLILSIRRHVAKEEVTNRRIFKALVFLVWFLNVFGLFGYLLSRDSWHSWLHASSPSSVSPLSSLFYYALSSFAYWHSALVVGIGRGKTPTSAKLHARSRRAMWAFSFAAFGAAAGVIGPATRRADYGSGGLQRGMGEGGEGGAVKALLGTDSVYLIFMMFGNLLLGLVCHQVDKACDANWKEVEELEGLKYDHKKV